MYELKVTNCVFKIQIFIVNFYEGFFVKIVYEEEPKMIILLLSTEFLNLSTYNPWYSQKTLSVITVITGTLTNEYTNHVTTNV